MATLSYVTGVNAATNYTRVGHNSSVYNNDAVWSFSISQDGADKLTGLTFSLEWNNSSAGTGWSGSYSYTFAISSSSAAERTAYSGTHLAKKAVTLSGGSGTATVSFTGLSLTPGTTYYLRANYSGTKYSTMKSFKKASNTVILDSYSKLKYTVSYNANGGTGAPASQQKTYGTNLTLSSTNPTRANASATALTVTFNPNSGSCDTASLSSARTTKYTFSKWNTAANGSGTNYNSGGTYTSNASATLYAQWTSSTTVAAITLPTATRTGYTFNGWYASASGGTKIGNAGESYTPTNNVTLYAQWTANTLTIYYYPNGATGIGSYEGATQYTPRSNYTSTITYGANTGKNLANVASLFVKTGYHRKSSAQAWCVGSATATTYWDETDQTIPSSYFANATNTVNLYANWAANTLTINFYGNGATGVGSNESCTDYSPISNITANVVYDTNNIGCNLYNVNSLFTRTGYTFNHSEAWIVGSPTSGVYWDDQSQDIPDSYLSNATNSVNLYANWIPNSYNLTINPNGGSYQGSSNNVIIAHSYNTKYQLRTPTRPGYIFRGWTSTPLNFDGTFYHNLDRIYMYENLLTYNMWVSMDDWSDFADYSLRFISCAQYGGFNIESLNGVFNFASYDKGIGYKSAVTTIQPNSLSPGYHMFTFTFDGIVAKGYIDGVLTKTSAPYQSGRIGYNATNSLLLGAEAGDYSETPNICFTGTINKFQIENAVWTQEMVSEVYSDNTSNSYKNHIFLGNTTLTARWIPITYNVIINSNGGTYTVSPGNISSINYDHTINLYNFNRPGYTYAGLIATNCDINTAKYGWYDEQVAPTGSMPPNGTIFASDITDIDLVNLSTIDGATVIIDIQWIPNTYTVTYDPRGGSPCPEPQIKTHDVDLDLSLPFLEKPNSSESPYTIQLNLLGGQGSPTSLTANRSNMYIFIGWNDEINGDGNYWYNTIFNENHDLTLYAQWYVIPLVDSVKLPTPIKDGYEFKGWSLDVNATSGMTDSWIPSGDATLFAIWELSRYTITYNANGGSGEPQSQIKIKGTPLNLSTTTPIRPSDTIGSYTISLNPNGGVCSTQFLSSDRFDNYIFTEWNTNLNGSGTAYMAGGTYNTDSDVTLYAQWYISQSTETITLPTPLRTDYRFLGWSPNPSDIVGVEGTYTPTGNITLYAIWTRNSYIIRYRNDDINTWENMPEPQFKTPGSPVSLSTIIPTRPNDTAASRTVIFDANGGECSQATITVVPEVTYSFKEWNTSIDGTGITYHPGALYTNDNDIDLYPRGTPTTINPVITLPIPTRQYYQFKGWSTNQSDSSGELLQYTVTSTTTFLYALWEQVEYLVDYDGNTGTRIPEPQIKYKDTPLTLSSILPVKGPLPLEGFTISFNSNGGDCDVSSLVAVRAIQHSFVEWNTRIDGSGDSYQPGSIYTQNQDTLLFAQWDSFTNTNSIVLPTPTRENYAFIGWALSTSSTSWIGGTTYTPTSDITLYALWEKIIFTITYDPNGGSISPQPQTKYKYVPLILSSNIPTRSQNIITTYTVTFNTGEGVIPPNPISVDKVTLYSFTGWNTKANGTGIEYNPDGVYNLEEDSTLYAQWEESVVTPSVTLPIPTRDGYNFIGWSITGSPTSIVEDPYIPSANITLIGVWERNRFTILYDSNGGIGSPPPQTKYLGIDLSLSLTIPTRNSVNVGNYTVTLNPNGGNCPISSLTASRTTEYVFESWNTQSNGSGVDYQSGGIYNTEDDCILYAKWSSTTITDPVSLPTPTRNNYTFLGWGESINSENGITGTYIPGSNIQLYAIWVQGVFVIQYNSNGWVNIPTSQQKTVEVPTILSTIIPTKADEALTPLTLTLDSNGGFCDTQSVIRSPIKKYTFSHWNTESDDSGTTYLPGSSYTIDADLTLYPIGVFTTEYPFISLPPATKQCHDFLGWTALPTSTVTILEEPVIMLTANITLFAVWYELGTFRRYIQTLDSVLTPKRYSVYVWESEGWHQAFAHKWVNGKWRITT